MADAVDVAEGKTRRSDIGQLRRGILGVEEHGRENSLRKALLSQSSYFSTGGVGEFGIDINLIFYW